MEMNVAVPKNALQAKKRQSTVIEMITRLLILLAGILVFFPEVNPGRVSLEINHNISLFTTATSYDTLVTKFIGRPFRNGWVTEDQIHLLMNGALLVLIGILCSVVGACLGLGNNRMKKRAAVLSIIGSVLMFVGLYLIYQSYLSITETATVKNKLDRIKPNLPDGIFVFAGFAGAILISSLIQFVVLLRRPSEPRMEMEEKYRLFLMLLPVIVLTFLFSYLPIYGWRFAFFNYEAGDQLTADKFVGFQWFSYLFENSATRGDLLRVLKNTLVMSGLGIATSWLPMAFAILLAEVRASKFQRFVQTFTTIPNFISWVLVYSIALSIFSTDGFINSFLTDICGIPSATNYLMSSEGTWIKMLLWGTWKGIGWSSIIYIAGIAGIDQQLYEAAKVDGANRWQCILHVTLPGLTPTYCVMLLMSIAGILSNGMEQYLVFQNNMNKEMIEVLDLYVYNIGIGDGLVSMSTVIGISKSLIAIILLFVANRISKSIRGESII